MGAAATGESQKTWEESGNLGHEWWSATSMTLQKRIVGEQRGKSKTVRSFSRVW